MGSEAFFHTRFWTEAELNCEEQLQKKKKEQQNKIFEVCSNLNHSIIPDVMALAWAGL